MPRIRHHPNQETAMTLRNRLFRFGLRGKASSDELALFFGHFMRRHHLQCLDQRRVIELVPAIGRAHLHQLRGRSGLRQGDAESSASPTAAMFKATMIWLATLVVWPSPLPPTSVMFLPMRSNKGLIRSKAASGPPTMMVRLPAFAPTSPPETGASR